MSGAEVSRRDEGRERFKGQEEEFAGIREKERKRM